MRPLSIFNTRSQTLNELFFYFLSKFNGRISDLFIPDRDRGRGRGSRRRDYNLNPDYLKQSVQQTNICLARQRKRHFLLLPETDL